jgi:hypothetical protein
MHAYASNAASIHDDWQVSGLLAPAFQRNDVARYRICENPETLFSDA